MNIIWLGHGSFRIEAGGAVLLIDPWLNGNPMLAEDQHSAALDGATHILVTHGHFDHTMDIAQISKDRGLPVFGMFELVANLKEQGAVEGAAFNMGGTVQLEGASVTLVPASHSSSMQVGAASRYMGTEAGFIIKADGHTLYLSGDTGIHADMSWIGEFFQPDIGILSAGGFYTMDMDMAAWAAKKYFDFKTVIPCHYRTFDALAQDAKPLVDGLPGVNVIEPQVMEPIIPA
ncbi:MAG: metal-dependent hydrolase [Pseudomonadota bacterium]